MARGSNKNNRNKFRNDRNKKLLHNNRKSNFKTHHKRKYVNTEKNDIHLHDNKRKKSDTTVQELHTTYSSSESEEIENPLEQLLNTFDRRNIPKKEIAVDTDSSENETESNVDSEELSAEDNEYSDTDVGDREENNEIANDNNTDKNEEKEAKEGEIEEDEVEMETDNLENEKSSKIDPFMKHFNYDLSENLVDSLQNTHRKINQVIEWSILGKLSFSIPTCDEIKVNHSSFTISENKVYAQLGEAPAIINAELTDLHDLHIKSQIHNFIKSANKCLKDEDGIFTDFQRQLFTIINNYQDLYYTERTFNNGEEIRFIYCLHAINHILKTRTKILHHNARLANKDDVPEEFRDQGLVRPKVLILVPFRDSVLRIVRMFIDILVPNEGGQVINKNRFMDDFSGNELSLPKINKKPEDYERTFAGNCDDTFKIGIQITKKSLKLYADFYSSDIIIASPLGLRLTVGAEGEADRDHDFLSSIEVLIMDQSELFLMQNWDHVLHILDHMHIQPKRAHGTDFARVRTWALNGWTRYYRQSLIFSSLNLPELNAVANRKCLNYAGVARITNPIREGAIVNVCVQVPQVYRRFDVDSGGHAKSIEARFQFFIAKVLPQFKDTLMKQCLIYIPSYFDYVRIRNYFKREDVSFAQICEYSKDAKIARARDMFFHGDAHFLLYSERFHYFKRIRVKGIRHIIFYQPPTFPHFYAEMCNFMQEANQNRKCGSASNMSVTVIYSKYDSHQTAAIVGNERLTRMATSTNSFHMFTSSD